MRCTPSAASIGASPSAAATPSAKARRTRSGSSAHLAAEEIGRIEPAEQQVGVGHGRLRSATAVADRPWRRRRRCAGRPSSGRSQARRARWSRRRRRSRSCRRPRPSAAGREPLTKRRTRPASKSNLWSGAPSSTRHIFAVVPPMSKDTTWSSPASCARKAAAMAPAAGPHLDQPDREVLGVPHRGDAAAGQHHVEPPSEADARQGPPPAGRGSGACSGCT